MAFDAGAAIGRLEMKLDGWKQSVEKVKEDQKSLAGFALRHKQEVQALGRSMTVLGASMTGAVALGVHAFATFDEAMTESTAIMGNLSDALRSDLVEAARQVARETTFTGAQAAKALYYIASAGYDANEAVKVLPVTAKFAQAGMFDLERATTLLADAQSALGLRIRDDAVANMNNMIRVADVLTETNILANGSIEQFSEALTTRAGAALRLVGKDVEEGAAVLAAFADQGVKGAEAGTRLDIVLRDLQTRAIKNAAAFERYGVTVFDSSGEMRNMADIIGDLERALAGKSDEMKRAIMMEMDFSDRSVASILNLIGMSDQIRRYEIELRKAGGTTETVANKQLETLNSQMKLMKNAITGAASSFGETLAPAVSNIVIKIKEAAAAVAAFAREHPGLTKAIALTTGGLGLLLTASGTFLLMLGSMARSILALNALFPGLAGHLTRLGPLLSKISLVGMSAFAGWNLGRYIGEVTGLDAVYQRCFDKVFRFVGIIKEQNYELGKGHAAAHAIQVEAIAQATEVAGRKVNNFVEAKRILQRQFQETGTTGNKVLDDWIAKFPVAQKAASDAGGGVKGAGAAFGDLGEMLKELGVKTRSELTAELKNAEAALAQLRGSAESTPGAVKALQEKIAELKGEMTGVTQETKSLAEQLNITTKSDIQARVKLLTRALVEYNGKLTADEIRRLRDELNGLYLKLSGLADMPKPTVGKAIFDDLSKIKGAWPEVSDTYEKIKGGLGDMADKSKDTTAESKGYFDGLWNDIATGFGNTIQEWLTGATTFKDFMTGLWDDIKAAFFRMIGQMVAGEAIKAIKGLFTDLLTTTKNAGAGIASATSSIGSAVGGIATGIATLITSLATAIATAANTLAAAAPAILKVGAVAIALYAGFKVVEGLVNSIFGSGGGGKQTDVTYWLRLQKDLQQEMHDWLFLNAQDKLNYFAEKLEDIKQTILDGVRSPLNAVCDKLDWIGGNTGTIINKLGDIVKKLGGGAYEGAVLTSPQLIMTHGTPDRPEYIIPEPDLKGFVASAQAGQASGKAGATEVNVTFQISAVDGDSVERITRTKIVPVLQNIFDHYGLGIPLGAVKGY